MSETTDLAELIREDIDMSLGKKLCPETLARIALSATTIESQAARIAELEKLFIPGTAIGMARTLFSIAESCGMCEYSSESPAAYIRKHISELESTLAATRSELEAVQTELRELKGVSNG